ncbi:ABC-type proline/glycine betaine transporter, permease [Corynebacterium humireducens NBRC 106098 = DSM 45392]|uniref:ABC-type proline/glycine betaine transporter, permease n=1 Tax=Corynebacterium humireducens NBRC 106098 = DSM 45392 TaxID=1223515 RepID=A0A0B5DB37_9CORY|nr:ABC transporter permease [Corynebacterium humireducens]AJE34172.1 ABC-type proline/glycine betaine transporter, permease [Corynebacterium humireducens NBRC 106098 = DSM 45392]
MNQISLTWAFLTDADRWPLILSRTLDHLGYTALAVGLALAVAVPLGLWVGHSRRGADLVLSVAGALRALPSLGLLTWLTVSLSTGVRMPLVPSTIVLVLLAVPPLLAGIVAGMIAVPRHVVDSARASGFSEAQILGRVEVPLALPVMIGGLRSCVVQVLATATIVAYIGLSGLGRYLIDGLALRDYPQMLAGAVLVTALALVVDLSLALLQKSLQPQGRVS